MLGLMKVVNLKAIEAADWSPTPGRYLGVAPAEVDEDFDFEQTLKDVQVERTHSTGKPPHRQSRFTRTLRGSTCEQVRKASA